MTARVLSYSGPGVRNRQSSRVRGVPFPTPPLRRNMGGHTVPMVGALCQISH
jgi:hypothetical protein